MALPSYTSGVFYRPGDSYGWDQSFDWWSGIGSGQRQAQDNPADYWERILAEQGFGGFGTRANAAHGILNRAQQGYGAATLTNPELRWTDFANNLDINHILNQMGGEARGENPQKYAPMDVRWIQRS